MVFYNKCPFAASLKCIYIQVKVPKYDADMPGMATKTTKLQLIDAVLSWAYRIYGLKAVHHHTYVLYVHIYIRTCIAQTKRMRIHDEWRASMSHFNILQSMKSDTRHTKTRQTLSHRRAEDYRRLIKNSRFMFASRPLDRK